MPGPAAGTLAVAKFRGMCNKCYSEGWDQRLWYLNQLSPQSHVSVPMFLGMGDREIVKVPNSKHGALSQEVMLKQGPEGCIKVG